MVTRSPVPNSSVTGTKSPATNSPETGTPPSVARFTRPPTGILIGEKDPGWRVLPSAPASESKVVSFSWSLLASEAMKVPESSWADTITAPSTSTEASRLLAPAAGV